MSSARGAAVAVRTPVPSGGRTDAPPRTQNVARFVDAPVVQLHTYSPGARPSSTWSASSSDPSRAAAAPFTVSTPSGTPSHRVESRSVAASSTTFTSPIRVSSATGAAVAVRTPAPSGGRADAPPRTQNVARFVDAPVVHWHTYSPGARLSMRWLDSSDASSVRTSSPFTVSTPTSVPSHRVESRSVATSSTTFMSPIRVSSVIVAAVAVRTPAPSGGRTDAPPRTQNVARFVDAPVVQLHTYSPGARPSSTWSASSSDPSRAAAAPFTVSTPSGTPSHRVESRSVAASSTTFTSPIRVSSATGAAVAVRTPAPSGGRADAPPRTQNVARFVDAPVVHWHTYSPGARPSSTWSASASAPSHAASVPFTVSTPSGAPSHRVESRSVAASFTSFTSPIRVSSVIAAAIAVRTPAPSGGRMDAPPRTQKIARFVDAPVVHWHTYSPGARPSSTWPVSASAPSRAASAPFTVSVPAPASSHRVESRSVAASSTTFTSPIRVSSVSAGVVTVLTVPAHAAAQAPHASNPAIFFSTVFTPVPRFIVLPLPRMTSGRSTRSARRYEDPKVNFGVAIRTCSFASSPVM